MTSISASTADEIDDLLLLDDEKTNDSVSDDDNPGPSKRIKTVVRKAGAAVYQTKFNRAWMEIYPFVSEVKGDPHMFLCTVCRHQVACGHQEKHDIERHVQKAMHQANARSLKAQTTLSFPSESSPIAEQVLH